MPSGVVSNGGCFQSFGGCPSHRLGGGVFDPKRLVSDPAAYLQEAGLQPQSKCIIRRLGVTLGRRKRRASPKLWFLICQPQGLGSHRDRMLSPQASNV